MWAIGDQRQTPSFPYPTIMTWTPPRNQLDCLGMTDSGLMVAGLGPASVHEKVFAGSGKNPGEWTWIDLWFGQRVLLKRRPRPLPMPKSQLVNPAPQYLTASLLDAPPQVRRVSRERAKTRSDAGPPEDVRNGREQPRRELRTLHQITDEVIASGFDHETVGRALLELAERTDGIELAGQYATIVAKARLSRRDRDKLG
jgi:hypothetical protein